ncbi:MAG: NADH-quinone oxidoreductase subunit N [Acidobacteriota bacterium]
MSSLDLLALLPLLVLGVAAVLVMLLIAFARNHAAVFALTLAALGAAFAALIVSRTALPRPVTELLTLDRFGAYFMGLLLVGAMLVTLLLFGYLRGQDEQREEIYLLLLTATLGSAVLVASAHFVSFFLGLETLTISLYTMIAYERSVAGRLEAAVKYLILAAVSSAFLLFGLALVYARLGTMMLAQATAQMQTSGAQDPLLLAGLALIVVGVGFKMALVPFHMWTPDVYQGAAAPITGFVATVSKGGVFAFLLRYFIPDAASFQHPFFLILSVIAAASMLGGNLLALLQNSVKRILAYSSIAHLGYLFVALLAGGSLAVTATSYYLAAYFITILAAFGVISVLSTPEREADSISDFQGLYWRRPWLSVVLTVSLLSLAGIPLTAGFIGKFYLAAAGVERTVYWLVGFLVVTSAIGLYYYLRIIVAMAAQPPAEAPALRRVRVPVSGGLALAGLFVALLWLGIYPASLLAVIRLFTAP